MVNKIKGNGILLFVSACAFGVALVFHSQTKRPDIKVTKQDSAINLNRDFLKLISLGNKRLIADLIWIQTLIESDEVHYKGKDLNNWMYHRFRTISELDQPFYENYLWGGMFLSIVKDDLEGAADIYERGLALYPTDYKLNYNSGFNYYFEMNEFEKGLQKLAVIEHYPETPAPIKFVINKLRYHTSGDYEAAVEFLTYNLQNTKDEKIRLKLQRDLYSLKADRDLACLNGNKPNCDRRDADHNAYIYREGKWQTQQPYRSYKIHRRSDQK